MKKTDKNSKSKSFSNIILNSIIAVLAVVILYMGFSIVYKLLAKSEADEISKKEDAAADIVQLEVLNGCGVSGIGDKFTNYLRNKKFDVVNVSNYISFDIDKTIVIDRTGNFANAKKVAKELGVDEKNVIQQINNDYFLDVSLIIGKDYNQLKPYN